MYPQQLLPHNHHCSRPSFSNSLIGQAVGPTPLILRLRAVREMLPALPHAGNGDGEGDWHQVRSPILAGLRCQRQAHLVLVGFTTLRKRRWWQGVRGQGSGETTGSMDRKVSMSCFVSKW